MTDLRYSSYPWQINISFHAQIIFVFVLKQLLDLFKCFPKSNISNSNISHIKKHGKCQTHKHIVYTKPIL